MSNYCHLCGRPLAQGLSIHVHPEHPDHQLAVCGHCHKTAPRCRRCGLPMRADMSTGAICALCAAGAPRCRSCGSPVTGSYVEINGLGPYCRTCHETRQHCSVCGVPLDARARYLPDGRAICATCQQTAVLEAGQAKSLFDWTVQAIQTALSLGLRVGVRFVVTDHPGLRAQIQKARPDLIYEADRLLGVYVREDPHRTIYVENGLPSILLIQVVAHEWAHAWQMENCPTPQEMLIVEGFAEWVAYKVLQEMGAVKKMGLMAARPDLYGEGLRLMLAREERKGIPGVLALCLARAQPDKAQTPAP